MFSVNTDAMIQGQLALLQSNIESQDPLISYLVCGGDIRAELGLEEIFTIPEFIVELKIVNTVYNSENKYSPTVDCLAVTLLVAHSEDSSKVAYLTTSKAITAKSIAKTEATLHAVLNKLTDNIYRLEAEV